MHNKMDHFAPIAATLGFVGVSCWLARLTRAYRRVPLQKARELTALSSFKPLRVLAGSYGGDLLVLLGRFSWQEEGAQAIVAVKSANRVPESDNDILRLDIDLQVESGAGNWRISWANRWL